jgi:hypothetical protein
MTLNGMSALWARTALLWFAVTVSIGLYMGISQDFSFTPAHAHLGVLGWLSSGVYAFLWSVARSGSGERAPFIHWAAHTLGVLLMTSGLALAFGLQRPAFEPLIPIGAFITVAAVYASVLIFWQRLRPEAS